MVNLVNVAKKANVSTATVSRVINGEPSVKKETKEKVLSVIKKLNYKPNIYARSLKKLNSLKNIKRKTFNIGCIVFSDFKFSDPYFSRILDGIDNEVLRNNYNLLFIYTEKQLKANPNLLLNKINDLYIDGVIIVSAIDKEIFNDLKKRIKNIVTVDAIIDENFDSVFVDKISAMRKVVKYLFDLGHRRIAFIGDCVDPEERFIGYKMGLSDVGISFDKELIEWEVGAWSRENGYKYMNKIVERFKEKSPVLFPTAVICASDLLAIGVIKALHEKGIKVPDDVSVTGYDDIAEAEYIYPSLTTVRVDKEKLGSVAVRRIVEKIQYPETGPLKSVLSGELIIRNSTGVVSPVRKVL